jgi:putative DNA primase/helicase
MDALRELDQSTARIDAVRAARTRAKNRVIPDDQPSLEDLANAEIEHAKKSEVVKNTSHPSQSARPKRQVVTSKKRPITDASRMGQNEMATAVTHGLCATLGFDPKSCGWHGRDADIWRPIPDTRARTAAEQAIEKLKPAFAAGYLSGVLKFLESRLSLPEWESDRNLLPMHNGVLNLATGELNDYGACVFNWQVPHKHDAKATCPTITRWLHTVTNGDNDLKAFLLAWMRVVLTGGAHLHKYVEIVGPGGTGKSTFIRLCQLLVGNANSVSTDLKTLEASRFESAGLYGKRLAIVSDSARYGGEVSTLKAITGGDPLRFEQKNIQAGESFVFAGVVMIAANEPIQSADYTSGLARRRIPIFFNQKVSEAEKLAVPDFESRLAAEIPGLLNLLLSIKSDEADNTIRNPGPSLARSKLAAELETNPLLAWMHERLIQCQHGHETAIGTRKTSGLYADYADYCDEHGREPVSTTRFSRLVVDNATSRGISTDKTRVSGSGERVLKKLRLRQASDPANLLFSVTGSNSSVTTCALDSPECDDCEGFSTTSDFACANVEVDL